MNASVRITDVSPRGGLQNEPGVIPTAAKVRLVEALCVAGLDEVEVTSFVSPKWVPQLADAEDLLREVAEFDEGVRHVSAAMQTRDAKGAGAGGARHRSGRHDRRGDARADRGPAGRLRRAEPYPRPVSSSPLASVNTAFQACKSSISISQSW